MTNKTKLKWRLSKLPEAHEVIALVANKLITQDEAKDILFSSETEEDRDEKSLKSEIKFLREMVDKLSSDKTRIVEVIKEVYKPYYTQPWYPYYTTWCSTQTGGNWYLDGASTTNTIGYSNAAGSGTVTTSTANFSNFSDIKTF